MTARFNNHSSKELLLAKVFKTMTFSTRRLWFVRASIPFFTLIYVWLGIVNLVSAEGLEGNKVVDMSSLSCGELLRIPLPQTLIAVGWIGGFFAGLKNDPKVNVLVFADKADQIIALCRENESTGVMALVERTFHPLQEPSTE